MQSHSAQARDPITGSPKARLRSGQRACARLPRRLRRRRQRPSSRTRTRSPSRRSRTTTRRSTPTSSTRRRTRAASSSSTPTPPRRTGRRSSATSRRSSRGSRRSRPTTSTVTRSSRRCSPSRPPAARRSTWSSRTPPAPGPTSPSATDTLDGLRVARAGQAAGLRAAAAERLRDVDRPDDDRLQHRADGGGPDGHRRPRRHRRGRPGQVPGQDHGPRPGELLRVHRHPRVHRGQPAGLGRPRALLPFTRAETSSGTQMEKILAGEYLAGFFISGGPAFPVVNDSDGLVEVVYPEDGTASCPAASASPPTPRTRRRPSCSSTSCSPRRASSRSPRAACPPTAKASRAPACTPTRRWSTRSARTRSSS